MMRFTLDRCQITLRIALTDSATCLSIFCWDSALLDTVFGPRSFPSKPKTCSIKQSRASVVDGSHELTGAMRRAGEAGVHGRGGEGGEEPHAQCRAEGQSVGDARAHRDGAGAGGGGAPRETQPRHQRAQRHQGRWVLATLVFSQHPALCSRRSVFSVQ